MYRRLSRGSTAKLTRRSRYPYSWDDVSYFLIAVSNRVNLDLCIKHALAGFTESINGLWTYLDIAEDDYVSFLYGARAYNLYQVVVKAAYTDAANLPPWPPVKFRKEYYFPFRLELRQVRALEEPLVRAEFAYVAENLLLRGGYRKTHFQADQTTLQNVSEMGVPSSGPSEPLEVEGAETFIPHLVLNAKDANLPYVFPVRELIIQTLLRRRLSSAANLDKFLRTAGIRGFDGSNMEVLGEKAFPEGHVDILIKEATPIGISRKVVVEVKLGRASNANVQQLSLYMDTIGKECAGGVLVANGFGKRVRDRAFQQGIVCMRYELAGIGDKPLPYDSLLSSLSLILAWD